MKGGAKRRNSVGSEVLVASIPGAAAGGDVHGDPDSVNDKNSGNPVNVSSSPASSKAAIDETHLEQNPEEVEEDGEEDEEEDANGQEGAPEAGSSERPKLDEGFYEIEAIRRKRVRKGQLQYFIKWRGWPETANTWEPLENLQSCSDFIDAFEESLRSGKHRKRKRKHGVVHTLPKKRQRPTSVNNDVKDVEINNRAVPSNKSSLADRLAPSQLIISNPNGGNVADANNAETTRHVDIQNGYATALHKATGGEEEHDYDPKLSELKAIVSTNSVNSDKFMINFQDPKAPEGNGRIGGISKADSVDLVHDIRRTGARRRKSGSVKRFKQELSLSEPGMTQTMTIYDVNSGRGLEQDRGQNSEFSGEHLSRTNKTFESRAVSDITKIIKPIGYSASVSNSMQDVLVTFMAMRSDGTEVIVDNKFLKANNPLLLINFYEQHLRYSPSS